MEFKLLVVDDEPKVVSTISEFFTDKAYRVLQAGSGDEAMAVIGQEPLDLVILDLQMPGLDGVDVLRQVRERYLRTKVLVVTGFPDREEEARAAGCDGFLAKPIVMGDLLRMAEALLTRKDEEDLRQVTMGVKMLEAHPGEPVAQILLFEPSETVAQVLLSYLGDTQEVKGAYKVDYVTSLDQALLVFLGIHPDIVLMDLLSVENPAKTARALLDCQIQPKEYIFYMHPHSEEEKRAVESLPGKRWDGNPWRRDELKTLARIIRKTALEHGLVKR